MQLKQYDLYTNQEIKELLDHWFKYYGKKSYSLAEYEQFFKMIDKEPKQMFEIAAMLCNKGIGSTPVLDAIRGNKSQLESLIEEYKTFSNITKIFLQRDFIEEVVNSYNNPEPAIPKDDHKLRQEIKDLTGKNYDYLPQIDLTKIAKEDKDKLRKIVNDFKQAQTPEEATRIGNQFFRLLQSLSDVTIDPEKVKRIFFSCMFSEEDIKDERPVKPCSIVDSPSGVYFLDTEKVNKHIMEIKDLIDRLPDLRKETSFVNLFFDRSNRMWTNDSKIVEILMVLGIAAERIEYAYPQEEWKAKNHGYPVIVELDNRAPGKIFGYEPNEVDEILEAIEASKNGNEYSKEVLSEAIEIFKTQYPHIEPVMKMSGYSIILEGNDFYLCRPDGEKINKMSLDVRLGSLSLVARDNAYSIKYTYSIDGQCALGGIIDSNTLSINGLKKHSDNTYDGRQIVVELGNGLINAGHDPRIEIKITEPSEEDIITRYEIDEFGFTVAIENDEEEFGNSEDGTKRIVKYTDVTKTPSNKVLPIFIGEKVLNVGSCYINIDGFVEDKFRHALLKYKADGSGKTDVLDSELKQPEEVMNIVNEYLKTTRVKNLYNHVSKHIENILPGMQEFIRNNYPLSNNIEAIMKETASPVFEARVNSNALKETDLLEDKNGIKKELTPEAN
ncbi:MAG: hypothetical protein K2I70_00915 [Bacilli bacterium]|nr:hypothetical protein [Bacilli bacterium]